MKFVKRGLVYKPTFDGSWRDNSALTPTPVMIDDETIRVYAGLRDPEGVSRIGYIELVADNPQIIKRISNKPVLDIGRNGMFDDNGIILGDVLWNSKNIQMFYVGFQLVKKAKFLAFTGLAVSADGGESFHRVSETPLLDRSEEGKYFRAIHSVMMEDEKIRIWYGAGSDWLKIGEQYYPKYDISTQTLDDLQAFKARGVKCVSNNPENKEYRIGRPRVYKWNDKYVMFYTYGTIDGRYMAGMAYSDDGESWQRNDKNLGIELSEEGWDSEHLSYPALITVKGRTFMFYNGNNMGYEGFGCAELIDISIT